MTDVDRALGQALLGLSSLERDRMRPYFEVVRFDAGALVVEQGARDRDLYVVVEGAAQLSRDGMDLGALEAGHHFGELGLIAGRPRAASVRAREPLVLAKLSRAAFEELSSTQPATALRLVESLLASLGVRLTEMTEHVGLLLRERSLPRRATINVEVGGEEREVPTGTHAAELIAPTRETVAALLDRKPISLSAPLSADCVLEPLSRTQWEGARVFEHSLALALLEAAERAAPQVLVRIGRSLGAARRVQAHVPEAELGALASSVQAALLALIAEDRPLREEWWTIEEARSYLRERGWESGARLLATWRGASVPMVSYGSAYVPANGPMVARTSLLAGASVEWDEEGLLLVHDALHPAGMDPDLSVEAARQVSRHVRRMTVDQERWLAALGVDGVGDFNEACVQGQVSEIIRISEGFHEKRIAQIADAIAARRDTLKVITIAGPSSSGKTTFIKRLRTQLMVDGVVPHGISLDDYYVDRERTPKDAGGEYDYEALEALDLALLASDLGRLLGGQVVRTARYDFVTGASKPGEGPELSLGEGHMLMLEGIHGLNPKLLESIAPEQIFRVFICPMSALPFDRLSRPHVSDLRLLRRIVRDRHGRGQKAAENIARWPSVRRGERKHIFPFQHHADAVFDSSLVYEPNVLRVYAERYLFEVPREHPAYTTAFRLLGMLERFVTIYPDHVPPTSILREFIGGSGFEY